MQIRISIFPDKKTYIKIYQYVKGTFLLIFKINLLCYRECVSEYNYFLFPPFIQAGSFKKWLTFVDVWIGGESIYQQAHCGRLLGSLKSQAASLPFDWLISQSEDIFHWAAECFISANAGLSSWGPLEPRRLFRPAWVAGHRGKGDKSSWASPPCGSPN